MNGVLKYEQSECFKLAMSNGFNGFFEFEMNFFYFLVKSRPTYSTNEKIGISISGDTQFLSAVCPV